MKNKALKIILVISIFSFLCIKYPIYNKVSADSGWDTSYDSGGSWDSDSSWDSGSSWDGNSSGGTSNPFDSLMLLIIIVLIVTLTSSKSKNEVTTLEGLSDEQIHNIDPTLDIEKFKKFTYDHFVNVQISWMNFDFDYLRTLLTDELYNMYDTQLRTLHIKGETNVMKDFKYINSCIKSIKIENNIETIDLVLNVRFKDYVVDSNNNITRGNSNKIYDMTYVLTYVKQLNTDNKCPNCGAPLDNIDSNTCPYCKSTVTINKGTFILSKKKLINQK